MRALERGFKRGIIRIAPAFFPSRRDARPLRRVLLVRIDDRLGNLVLLTPALDYLRSRRPDLEVDLLLSRTFASIFESDPRPGKLMIVDKSRQKAFFPTYFHDLTRVGGADYDAAIECSNRDTFSFSSALYAQASRSPRRIGFANELSRNYLTEEVRPQGGEIHAARDPVILAAHLLGEEAPGLGSMRLRVHLPPARPALEEDLRTMVEAAGGRVVGLFVGGRGAKRWPLERFVALADRLLQAGFFPWIFSGPREPEVEPSFGPMRARGVTIMPRTDVVDVGHAFRCCRAVVAADSGPMHLASAVGTPTVAIFLSSDAERYRPFGPEDRWIGGWGRDTSTMQVLEILLAMPALARRDWRKSTASET
jgi:heptosyltransferase III